MWQIYSNDSAVARGVSRWKTNPLFFRPFTHSRTLFRPLCSLFKSIWNFLTNWSCEKQNEKIASVSFISSSAAPPFAAATAAPTTMADFVHHRQLSCWCFCHKTSMRLKLLWHSCLTLETLLRSSSCSSQCSLIGIPLAFRLSHSAQRREAISSLARLSGVEQVSTRSHSLSTHSYHLSVSTC